ncbi:phosphate ABC transporter permease PstA [Rothia nasimurium]|uniref:phosphate ABC transporter permease PstA n=1 Tax=Rothia nasimurium TaxID=85336 RepID=UPI001F0110B6|nr:phosphate ABC transporter permease PstA [Rothia nasimurium]
MSVATTSSRFASRQAPRWLPYAIGAGAIILGAAASSLIGFSIATFVLFSGLIFVIAGPLVVGSYEGRRKGQDAFARYLVYGTFLVALIPLVSVLYTVLVKGVPGLSGNFLMTSMKGVTGVHDNAAAAGEGAVLGGIYHAIIGTLEITLLATFISVPIGLLTAIYLVEYGQGKWLSKAITFFVDVMTGIPSIVAGLFAASFFALVSGNPMNRMGLVAAVALSVLMIPTVVRNAEEMLRIVPNELREASYALGVRKWRTIMKVVIPTAISGIASGVTLAIARVIGETAPILVTAGFVTSINWSAFSGWMATLPTYIYYQIMTPTSPTAATVSETRAWAAALILIIIVMILNLIARAIAKIFAPKTGR